MIWMLSNTWMTIQAHGYYVDPREHCIFLSRLTERDRAYVRVKYRSCDLCSGSLMPHERLLLSLAASSAAIVAIRP
jgi:hypothetical protein